MRSVIDLLSVPDAAVLTVLSLFFLVFCATLADVMVTLIRAKVEYYAGNHNEAVQTAFITPAYSTQVLFDKNCGPCISQNRVSKLKMR